MWFSPQPLLSLRSAPPLARNSSGAAPKKIHQSRIVAETGPWWQEILNVLDREIILASVLSFGSHVTFPAVASFLVLYARELGIDNIGWFYVVSGITSILCSSAVGQGFRQDRPAPRLARVFCSPNYRTTDARLCFRAHRFDDFRRALYGGIGHEQLDHLGHRHGAGQTRTTRRAMATFSIALPLSNGVGALDLRQFGAIDRLFLDVSCRRGHCRRRFAGYDGQPCAPEVEEKELRGLITQWLRESLSASPALFSIVLVRRDRGRVLTRTRSRTRWPSRPRP